MNTGCISKRFQFASSMLLWMNVTFLAAQTERLYVERISVEQGLSQTTIFGMMQDRRGFMWFGTEDGLNRYDGYQFRIFKNDPFDSTSLSNNYINTLYEDRRRFIWVMTLEGVNRYDPRDEKFLRFKRSDDTTTIAGYRIENMAEDSVGHLWCTTDRGMLLRVDENGKIQERWNPRSADDMSSVQNLQIENGNRFFLSTNSGLYICDPTRRHVVRYHREAAGDYRLSENSVRSVVKDRRGWYYVATYGGGLYMYDEVWRLQNNFKKADASKHGLTEDDLQTLYCDRAGRIWVGSEGGGLFLFSPEQNKFLQFKTESGDAHSLSNNLILRLTEDRTGVIWIGHRDGGISKYDPQRIRFVSYRHDPDHTNSLSHNSVYSIFEDPADSGKVLWIGTNGGGLNRWDRITQTFRSYVNTPGVRHTIGDNSVRFLFKDSEGVFWVGTNKSGLQRMDTDRGLFEPSTNPNIKFIRYVIEDRKDKNIFWVGTNNNGVFRIEKSGKILQQYSPQTKPGLSFNIIRGLYQDSDGKVWVATQGGGLNCISADGQSVTVYNYDPTNPQSLSNSIVLCILPDTTQNIFWLGTAGGLNRFDSRTGITQHFRERDGLANDVVYGVLRDEKGFLWMSTNGGLSKFDPKTSVFRNYDTKDGLQSNEFNAGAFFKNQNGEMFFGGIQGFNVFHPDRITDNTMPVSVVLTQFQIANQPVAVDPNGVLKQSVTESQQIVLPYAGNAFAFEFSALMYHAPEQHQYAYRLEGFDKTWLYSGTRRYVSYTNLDPGEYIFRVKASNHDGVWNEDGASMMIIITPPFWQTWWFRLLMLGFAGLIVWGMLKLRSYYAEYRKTHYVSHYKLLEKIGEGGMGVVYKARDRVSGKTVALKLLHESIADTKDGLQRFLKEAEVGKLIHHPNVVKIYGAGSSETRRFITMEMVEGKTLKQTIRERGVFTKDDTKKIIIQLVEGLAQIHVHGVVHRDLKSDNIIIKPDGRVVIMDFGLARIKGMTSVAARDQLVGTLAYMSPEQTIGKEVDHRSDIYSLGVITYEMLYGEMPFIANNEMELILAIHNETPKHIDANNVDALHQCIKICLSKDPIDRYPDTTTLRKFLDTV